MMQQEWNDHWSNKYLSLNKFFNFYRKYVMSNALSYFFEKYFPKEGIFVECGSGTSMTSYSVKKHKRKLAAMDISEVALKEARKIKKIDFFVQGDIIRLPLKTESVDGLWNLGVMEHFTPGQIDRTLQEFKRVLKKDACIIMFWPPVFSSTGIVYRLVEKTIKITTGKTFRFYPDEISRLKSKKHARSIIKKNGFKECNVYFPWRNCFGDLVVVARK